MSDDTRPPVEGPAPPPPSTAPPPAAAPPSRPRPVLRRSSSDRVLSGVAGGLARTFDLDPVVVRIIVVVVCLSFPPALIAYLAAWLLVARDDEPSRPPSGGIAFRHAGGVAFWLGVAILVAAGLAALNDPFTGGFGLVPLILIGIGVALWTRDGHRAPASVAWPTTAADDPTPAAPATADTTDTTATTATAATTAAADTTAAAGATSATAPPAAPPSGRRAAPVVSEPPPPPRPRSPLGAITIALALIAAGVVAALDQVPGIPLDADATHLAAVALLVLGLGQLVGALWGRARWLTLVALLLLPPVVVGAAVREVQPDFAFARGIDIGDGIGERDLVVRGAESLPEDVRVAAGTITVDLEDWEPTAAQLAALEEDDSDLVISAGVGEVVLITPTAVPWRVVADVGLGDLSVRDGDGLVDSMRSDDMGSPLAVVRTGGPQDGPVLDIVVDLRLGELDLHTPTFDDTVELP